MHCLLHEIDGASSTHIKFGIKNLMDHDQLEDTLTQGKIRLNWLRTVLFSTRQAIDAFANHCSHGRAINVTYLRARACVCVRVRVGAWERGRVHASEHV